MIWLTLITLITLVIFITDFLVKPRLDYTRDKKLLLWYGKQNRNFIEIRKI